MNDLPELAKDLDAAFCHDLPTHPKPEMGKVLVTGASGYIGGRLVPELLARGYAVRVMVRGNPSLYEARWPGVEAVQANALDEENLTPAFEGIHTAYYLIHSLLLGPKDFHKADVYAAFNFKRASHEAGVKRIIHLGGMDCPTTYSAHLQSRLDVAQELVDGAIPVTTLRAAVIIGSGSASYEIIHHLVDRLPLIPIPRWAENRCQPIAVRDVIKYLVGVLETPETSGTSYDIGGKDVLTYKLMLKIFADVVNLKILFVTSPISSIRLLSFLASQLTPVPPQIVSCLMEGVRDEAICRNDDIRQLVPFEPLIYRESVVRALTREEQDRVHTRWSDAYPPAHELAIKLHELQDKPAYTASYSIPSEKDGKSLFRSTCTIGGETGWFHNNWMWRIRGAVDRVLFGVGSARGRKRRVGLRVNDVVDFWRVEDVQASRRLLLRAEMKLPGKAWLEFSIGDHAGQRLLSITAYFAADGFWGRMYWYLFLPFHNHIFNGLIEKIEKRA